MLLKADLGASLVGRREPKVSEMSGKAGLAVLLLRGPSLTFPPSFLYVMQEMLQPTVCACFCTSVTTWLISVPVEELDKIVPTDVQPPPVRDMINIPLTDNFKLKCAGTVAFETTATHR